MPYRAAKISFDGSHYIATPKENFPQGHKRRRAARPLSVEEVKKKEQFEAVYKESQKLPRKERKAYISPQYYEYGEFIEDGERTDLTDIMHDIENGMSFYDLSKKHGNRFIRVMKWAKEYRQSHLENKFKRVFRNMKVYYIYGSAGCGKTSYVFQKHGYDDVYRTTNYEFGWIDDYNGEKILFLDEFRSSFKISEILDYLDGQPIRIRGRHYNRVACYDTVYIVSNLSLKEQYTNIQQTEPKTWAAFCRRITAVYDFDKSKDIPVNKFTGELKKPPTLIEIADDGDMPF